METNNNNIDYFDGEEISPQILKIYSKKPELWGTIIASYPEGFRQKIIGTPYSIEYFTDCVVIGEKTMYSDFTNETEPLYNSDEMLKAINYDNL